MSTPRCVYCEQEADGPMFTLCECGLSEGFGDARLAHARCLQGKLDALLDPDHESHKLYGAIALMVDSLTPIAPMEGGVGS